MLVWLVPSDWTWLLGQPDLLIGLGHLQDSLALPEPVREALFAALHLSGPLIILICSPAPPDVIEHRLVTSESRLIAGTFDFAAASIALARPVDILLRASFDLPSTGALDLTPLHEPQDLAGILTLPAWFFFTSWHLMRREQTLGQYVARYRLVHAGLPLTWREPVYQAGNVLIHFVRSVYNWPVPREYQNVGQIVPKAEHADPRWYASASVHAEKLGYDDR